ncbi:ubiquitin-like protein ISG15 [Rhynchocyon petersi]
MRLAELKQLVARELNVPFFQLQLSHLNGEELQNKVPLTSQGLGPGSTVSLKVRPCKPMSILVNNNKGSSRAYTVQLTDKVSKLKQQVCQQEGVETDLFWLEFEGRPMDEQQMLGEYGLTPHCTVLMNFRLRGAQICTGWNQRSWYEQSNEPFKKVGAE